MTLSPPSLPIKKPALLSTSLPIKSFHFSNFFSQSIHSSKPTFPSLQNQPLLLLLSPKMAPFLKTSHSFHAPFQLFDKITDRILLHSNAHISFESSTHKSIACIIRAIGSSGSDDIKRGIHAAVIKTGLESEVSITTSLIGLYSSLREVESMRRLFYSVPNKDLILWSAMISALCKNGQYIEAIVTFREMRSFKVSLNCVTLLSILPACANVKALSYGKQMHGWIIRRELHSETSLQNSLIDMYAKCGNLHSAMLVFSGIKVKEEISWKNIIFGFIENGMPMKALLMFSDMLRVSRFEGNEILLRNVISVSSQVGDLKFGLALHCYAVKNGFNTSTSIGTSLLSMYGEHKEVETAQRLFDELHYRDDIAWSAMVCMYSQSGHYKLALEQFRQMQVSKKEANEITLVSLVQACSSMEAQNLGRSIHANVLRLGFSCNMFITSALIDFYCKIGRLREGEVLFNSLHSRDLVCCSSMIKGYGINGCGEEAIETFHKMMENGLMPNEVVFVSLLSACSHCGLLDEGWKWFYSMENKFGISPTLAHYTCMIDLLGRRGEVETALEFIERMPLEPDVNLWGALLSWCRTTHDDVKIAEVAVEKLMRLDLDNTSYYVTLANMYSKLGRWKDAERIRRSMEEKGLRKIPGYSLV